MHICIQIMSACSSGSVAGSARSLRCSDGNFSLSNSSANNNNNNNHHHHNNNCNNGMELESLYSARSTPVCGYSIDGGITSATLSSTSTSSSCNYGPSPRRHPSAGKLPWEGNKKSSESNKVGLIYAFSQCTFIQCI